MARGTVRMQSLLSPRAEPDPSREFVLDTVQGSSACHSDAGIKGNLSDF